MEAAEARSPLVASADSDVGAFPLISESSQRLVAMTRRALTVTMSRDAASAAVDGLSMPCSKGCGGYMIAPRPCGCCRASRVETRGVTPPKREP